ncbi:MAG: hypothetical protein MRY63_02600 [Neomegalonema sp.]|nr:hypothetical protein [Neomegalonema sp.]
MTRCTHNNTYFRCVGELSDYEVSCAECGASFRGTRAEVMAHPLWTGPIEAASRQMVQSLELPAAPLRKTA